jgi:hypothetical protein
MDFAISGATTRNAEVATSLGLKQLSSGSNQYLIASKATLLTVTAGSNVFTAKYRVQSGGTTSTYVNRSIIVIDLGS